MVKMFVACLFLFLIFFFGIKFFRKLTGKEKYNLTKWLGYSITCTLLTLMMAAAIIHIF
jgi:lipopolysaccharide export LptBFGC system permease protein LptF